MRGYGHHLGDVSRHLVGRRRHMADILGDLLRRGALLLDRRRDRRGDDVDLADGAADMLN